MFSKANKLIPLFLILIGTVCIVMFSDCSTSKRYVYTPKPESIQKTDTITTHPYLHPPVVRPYTWREAMEKKV